MLVSINDSGEEAGSVPIMTAAATLVALNHDTVTFNEPAATGDVIFPDFAGQ